MEANTNAGKEIGFEEFMAVPDHCYDSLPESHITFGGGGGGPGWETPKALYYLNLEVVITPATRADSMTIGEKVRLQLGLTIPQMAEIVKRFFHETVSHYGKPNPKKNIFNTFLRRLLQKRWALMTSPVAKGPLMNIPDFPEADDWIKAMQYTDLKPWG